MDSFAKWTKIGICICLGVANIFIWYAVWYWETHQNPVITFFDVGQGDAIFIEAPNGNQILIDGGPGNAILAKLGSVMPFWDRHIDLLLLTHPHADHLGGFIEVLRRYGVEQVLGPAIRYTTPEYQAWRNIMDEKKIREVAAFRGRRIDVGRGIFLDVFAPFENFSGRMLKNPHDANVVVRLRTGDRSWLFMGDAEKPIEHQLRSNPGEIASDILKVGHHGSKTSSTEAFLRAVNPRFAVISVGRKNRYGHPHPEVLERFERFGIPVLRTDIEGDITFVTDGVSLTRK